MWFSSNNLSVCCKTILIFMNCPKCNSTDAIPFVYDDAPNYEAVELHRAGKIKLANYHPNAPHLLCKACSNQWRE